MKTEALTVITLLASFTATPAHSADYPSLVARYTYSKDDCHKRIKNMQSMIKHWSPGTINYFSSDAFSPPNYYMYKHSVMPYWEFIGDMYYNGCPKAGLVADKTTAALWYQNAAKEFVPNAQFKLGRMLFWGDGVPSDVAAGRAWIDSAALEGSPDALDFLKRANFPVPKPISPNSYTLAALRARDEQSAKNAANRAAVVGDLSRLVVNIAAIYVTANAASRLTPAPQPRSAQPVPTISTAPIMRRPAYCNAYGTITNNDITGSVWVNVSTFCR